jgi:hypothetical protein
MEFPAGRGQSLTPKSLDHWTSAGGRWPATLRPTGAGDANGAPALSQRHEVKRRPRLWR